MIDLGTVRPGSTIRIPFSSFDKDDGSSITMTNFAVGDILLYKDGSTTERASTSGFTATTDFDSKTGKHVIVIDLADNTTSGFYCAGSEYLVAVDAVTIDGVTTGGWVARFRIGYPNAIIDTTIATLASQTSFTLTSGPAEDNALVGHWAIIHDIASAVQLSRVLISAYTGSTKTVTLAAGATFTAAAGDNISIMDMAPLQATTLGRTLDVSAGGEAGIDWANVGTPSSTVNLSGTTVKTATDVESVVNSVTFGLSALKTLIDTLTTYVDTEVAAIKLKTDNLPSDPADASDIAAAFSSVNSTLATISAYIDTEVAAIKAKTDNLPGDPADASDVSAAFSSVNSTLATIAAYIDTEVAAIKSKTDNLPANPAATSDIPSASAVADAIWDELLSGHATSGSAGAKLSSLSAGGDATLAKQEEILTAIGDLSAGTGSGAYTLTITVNDGTTVLQGATVRLVEGVTSLVGTTNASGVVAFSVDAATYAVAITKDGYSFNPTTKVVSGTGSQTYSMTQVASSGSSDPDKSEVTITCYGTDTEPEAGVTLTIQQTSAPNGDENHAFDGTAWTETSDSEGLVSLTLWRNANYRIKRGAARRWTDFTPNAAAFDIDSFAGADE